MDMFVLDPGAHAFRAGRAEDFPADAQTPYVVLPSVVRTSDDADSSITEPDQVPCLLLCLARVSSTQSTPHTYEDTVIVTF